MNKIKAVIFDMDGVLIDAKEWHYEALNRALGLFGYEISRYEHLVTYDGLPTADKLSMMTLEKQLPKGLHKYINALKQEYTMEKVFVNCRPLFVHEYALSKLKSEGYRLAVASNSLSNQDVTKAKPDPEIYNVAIERLGLNPWECLVVEDNKNGIAAAAASGANVMKVETVYDVNYDNIRKNIERCEAQ